MITIFIPHGLSVLCGIFYGGFAMDKTKKSLLALTECSIMIALSTVLSVLKIIDLPYGGSITAASMLPIVVAVYRHGGIWGIGVALVNSTIQLLFGMNTLSYAVNWQAAVAIIVFDYIAAFSVFALSAVFKKHIKGQNIAVLCGVLLASVLRFISHTVVGCTVWAGISIPTGAAIIYSISYNATYMIPETIILALASVYVFSVLDFRYDVPRRIRSENFDKASAYCAMGAGLSVLAALIVDVALVFSKLQNEESGELDFSGFASVNYTALGIVTGVAAAVAIALVIIAKARQNKTRA